MAHLSWAHLLILAELKERQEQHDIQPEPAQPRLHALPVTAPGLGRGDRVATLASGMEGALRREEHGVTPADIWGTEGLSQHNTHSLEGGGGVVHPFRT